MFQTIIKGSLGNYSEYVIMPIDHPDAFVVVDDRDLEFVVRYSIDNQKVLGMDLGVISYNETPLKGIVASGITTISTDFAQMGKAMAEMILNHHKPKLDNPFLMNRRNSF